MLESIQANKKSISGIDFVYLDTFVKYLNEFKISRLKLSTENQATMPFVLPTILHLISHIETTNFFISDFVRDFVKGMFYLKVVKKLNSLHFSACFISPFSFSYWLQNHKPLLTYEENEDALCQTIEAIDTFCSQQTSLATTVELVDQPKLNSSSELPAFMMTTSAAPSEQRLEKSIKQEMSEYSAQLNEIKLKFGTEHSTLNIWYSLKSQFPKLYRVARVMCCVTASNQPVERAFNNCPILLTKK